MNHLSRFFFITLSSLILSLNLSIGQNSYEYIYDFEASASSGECPCHNKPNKPSTPKPSVQEDNERVRDEPKSDNSDNCDFLKIKLGEVNFSEKRCSSPIERMEEDERQKQSDLHIWNYCSSPIIEQMEEDESRYSNEKDCVHTCNKPLKPNR